MTGTRRGGWDFEMMMKISIGRFLRRCPDSVIDDQYTRPCPPSTRITLPKDAIGWKQGANDDFDMTVREQRCQIKHQPMSRKHWHVRNRHSLVDNNSYCDAVPKGALRDLVVSSLSVLLV